MPRFRLCSFLLVLPILASAPGLMAFDDWQPITQEELKMTSDSAHPADAIILYHEETADDMTRHRYVYLREKILTEKGLSRANVEIPFDATEIGVTDIRGRTIAPDGTITPFTGKAFNSTIVKAHGVKYLAKTFTLSNVQVGSIIEWKFTEFWDDFLYAPHWFVQRDLYQKRAKFTFIPFEKAGYDITDARGDIKDRLYYTLTGLPATSQINLGINGRRELEMKDVPAFQEEEFAPPSNMLKMRVDFYYGTSKMSKPVEFWKSEGKLWSKAVDNFATRSAALTAAVDRTVNPSDTAEQKARKIYAFVQKIKNLNYSKDEGPLEDFLTRKSREKRTLDDVLAKNEGYRNEIARLFLAMARAANIPAHLMWVADRDEVFFQVNVPDRGQLRSEIAIVTLDGKDVYLDPGTPLCPFGHLAWKHTSTQGIRQTDDGSTALAPTPSASYKDAISKRVGHVILGEDGVAKGKIGVAWTGEEALVHRLNGLKTDAAGRKKDLEDELKAALPAGAMVQLDSASGWDDPEAQLTASFTVEIPSYASATAKRLLVPQDMFQTKTQHPFTHGERKNPIYFIYPYYSMDETQITFPASFHLENLSQPQPLQTDFSIYKVQHVSNGNTVTTSRDFAMAGIAFQQKDYADLRKFYSAVVTGDSEPIVLTAVK